MTHYITETSAKTIVDRLLNENLTPFGKRKVNSLSELSREDWDNNSIITLDHLDNGERGLESLLLQKFYTGLLDVFCGEDKLKTTGWRGMSEETRYKILNSFIQTFYKRSREFISHYVDFNEEDFLLTDLLQPIQINSDSGYLDIFFGILLSGLRVNIIKKYRHSNTQELMAEYKLLSTAFFTLGRHYQAAFACEGVTGFNSIAFGFYGKAQNYVLEYLKVITGDKKPNKIDNRRRRTLKRFTSILDYISDGTEKSEDSLTFREAEAEYNLGRAYEQLGKREKDFLFYASIHYNQACDYAEFMLENLDLTRSGSETSIRKLWEIVYNSRKRLINSSSVSARNGEVRKLRQFYNSVRAKIHGQRGRKWQRLESALEIQIGVYSKG